MNGAIKCTLISTDDGEVNDGIEPFMLPFEMERSTCDLFLIYHLTRFDQPHCIFQFQDVRTIVFWANEMEYIH